MAQQKTPEQLMAFFVGQISALGVAINAIIKTHPQGEELDAAMRDATERMIAKAIAENWPDEMILGIESARNQFLLEMDSDPGQPSRTPPTNQR